MTADSAAQELFWGFDDPSHMIRVVVRLAAAIILGGVLGLEREKEHKAAGLRTHMLVSLGAALFVLVPLEAGVKPENLTRIIQGLAEGIGFIGAGTILKLSEEHQIKGLTTAASIWVAAAIGMVAGIGWLWPAFVGVLMAWVILYFIGWIERWMRGPGEPHVSSG